MVQKSVVVLCSKPLFGPIRMILESCTHAYFENGHFNDHSILLSGFSQLSFKFKKLSIDTRGSVFEGIILRLEHLIAGISIQDFVLRYRKNALSLLKLMLLSVSLIHPVRLIRREKKVILYGIPVGDVCNDCMALISLLPDVLMDMTIDDESSGTSLVDVFCFYSNS